MKTIAVAATAVLIMLVSHITAEITNAMADMYDIRMEMGQYDLVVALLLVTWLKNRM